MLLDLGQPDMDGKDVIIQIRRWSQIPIIVLSARDRIRSRQTARYEGWKGQTARNAEPVDLVIRTTHMGHRIFECELLTGL